MNDLIVAGLDLSLTGTGICTIDGETIRLRTVATKPGQYANVYDRIDHIATECMRDCDDAVLVCIEEPFVHHQRIKTSINLLALAYMVRRSLTRAGVRWADVAPSRLKKFVLQRGSGDKSQVLKEVYKRWVIDAADDNQADACVLAKIAQALVGLERDAVPNLTRAQGQVVADLRF